MKMAHHCDSGSNRREGSGHRRTDGNCFFHVRHLLFIRVWLLQALANGNEAQQQNDPGDADDDTGNHHFPNHDHAHPNAENDSGKNAKERGCDRLAAEYDGGLAVHFAAF